MPLTYQAVIDILLHESHASAKLPGEQIGRPMEYFTERLTGSLRDMKSQIDALGKIAGDADSWEAAEGMAEALQDRLWEMRDAVNARARLFRAIRNDASMIGIAPAALLAANPMQHSARA